MDKAISEKIAKILCEKKCTDVLVIDVSEKTDITNSFIVCTARTMSLARAAYEEVCSKLEAEGIFSVRVDGQREGKWIVIDYGDVIVHIFHKDAREFYNFEKLWADSDFGNVKHIDE